VPQFPANHVQDMVGQQRGGNVEAVKGLPLGAEVAKRRLDETFLRQQEKRFNVVRALCIQREYVEIQEQILADSLSSTGL
jgi:hypothetical protein